jgi:hypothetical protein
VLKFAASMCLHAEKDASIYKSVKNDDFMFGDYEIFAISKLAVKSAAIDKN